MITRNMLHALRARITINNNNLKWWNAVEPTDYPVVELRYYKGRWQNLWMVYNNRINVSKLAEQMDTQHKIVQ